MRLLRFNLIFLPLLLLAVGAAGYIVRESLHRSAQQEVLQSARVMMETAAAARAYTTKQIDPLLQRERFRIERAEDEFRQVLDQHLPAAFQAAANTLTAPREKQALLEAQKQALLAAQKKVTDSLRQRPREVPEAEFHPQTVPSYAATEIFNYFRAKYPDYAYKEATLNPTNLRDRAADWEADVVNNFRQFSDKKEIVGRRDTATGGALYLGAPIKINNSSCLVCHSTPDKAPPEMIKSYGANNGFGWKLDEIIGAQIVSVPESVPKVVADKEFRTIALWLAGIFGALFVLANLAALLLTSRPLPTAVPGSV